MTTDTDNLERVMRDALRPLIKRIDEAEARASEWQEKSDALNAQLRAKQDLERQQALEDIKYRFRVNIATEFLAARAASGISEWDCDAALKAADMLLLKAKG